MTKLRPTFEVLSRNFSSSLAMPNLSFRVRRYGKAAKGGCKSAEVEARGSLEALYELFEMLRCPAVIFDEHRVPSWWGFISAVDVYSGKLRFGVSIDSMANSVAVAYEDTGGIYAGRGRRQTTSFLANTDSTTEFGTKELMITMTNANQAEAEARRAEVLERKKFPVPFLDTMSGEGGPRRAVITCTGWFGTLGWRYFATDKGLETYSDIGIGEQIVGANSATEACRQSFQVSQAWPASSLAVRMKKVGSPGDNTVAGLYADSGGNPGSLLASGQVAAGNISPNSNWVEFTLNTPVSLAASTTYHIKVSRSGALNSDNFYKVDVNEDLGYANGNFRVYGGSWVARDPDADMLFKVIGVSETTQQILEIETACGEFITGVEIETASGISKCPYRDGDQTALAEILELMKSGTSSNRRLLAEVTYDRVLRIYEEPAKPTAGSYYWTLDSKCRLYSERDIPISIYPCPTAFWCGLKDVLPSTLDMSKLISPAPFFVEESEVDVEAGRIWLRPRDMESPWEIGFTNE